jgi:hypothetical protein
MKPLVFVLVRAALALCASALSGCPDSAGSSDTEPPRWLGLGASTDVDRVSLRGPITLRFSEPLLQESALDPNHAVLVESIPTAAVLSDIANPPMQRAGAIECDRTLEDAGLLTLWPRRPLRADVEHSIVVTAGLRDLAGNRLADAPLVVTFRTVPARVELLLPRGPAPANAAILVLGFDRPLDEPPVEGDVVLEMPDGRAESLSWSGPLADPRMRAFRLPDRLAPGEGYRVIVRDGEEETALGFAVSAEASAPPPRISSPNLRAFDGALEVRVSFESPSFARLLFGNDPARLVPLGPPSFGTDHDLGALGLVDGARIFVRVEAWGISGEPRVRPAMSQDPLSAIVHPFVRLELSEVVTQAQRDWADRRCDCAITSCGAPFDATPGCSTRVGSESELVELVNLSGERIDLTGWGVPWRLRIVDSTPEEVELLPDRARLYFAAGSSADAWLPGAALVVKPSAPINNDARLELIDPYGAVVDRVLLGSGDVPNGRSTGTDDEAVVRDRETGRWCRARATPGAPNASCEDP